MKSFVSLIVLTVALAGVPGVADAFDRPQTPKPIFTQACVPDWDRDECLIPPHPQPQDPIDLDLI